MKRLLTFITTLFLFASLNGQILRYSNYTAPTPPITNDFLTNLVAYWAFEESSGALTDSQGDADMTNHGASYGATGINGNCLDFEETESDYLNRANIDALEMYNNDYTLALWINVESVTTTEYNGLIGGEYGAGGIVLSATSGNLYGQIVNFGSYLETSLSPTVGNWTFVAMSVDVTETGVEILYYMNGTTQTTSRSLTFLCVENAASCSIGSLVNDGSQNYDGLIDEVMIWRGRALTEDEFDDLYNSGTGLFFADFD